MSHLVKCRWCGQHFDTDKIEADLWIMPSKGQYYHKSCFENKQKPNAIRPGTENSDEFEIWKQTIFDLIQRDLKGECNFARITQQLKQYKQQNKDWTYKGMYFALRWFYVVNNNDWSKANGALGILPYIYYQGTEYWRQQEQKQHGIVKEIEQQIKNRENRETIIITKKKEEKNKHRFSLEDNDDD